MCILEFCLHIPFLRFILFYINFNPFKHWIAISNNNSGIPLSLVHNRVGFDIASGALALDNHILVVVGAVVGICFDGASVTVADLRLLKHTLGSSNEIASA